MLNHTVSSASPTRLFLSRSLCFSFSERSLVLSFIVLHYDRHSSFHFFFYFSFLFFFLCSEFSFARNEISSVFVMFVCILPVGVCAVIVRRVCVCLKASDEGKEKERKINISFKCAAYV